MIPASERRLLFVHAHPDDESSQTALTMAKYAAEGAQVTLVTCTLGELGEIVAKDLQQLSPRELAQHRLHELTAAMSELGVDDFVRLGGDGRYHDSGMTYGPGGAVVAVPDLRADAFWSADLTVAADDLVGVIRDRRPQVIVTYDDLGGYGHPDHIQAHRVTMYAAMLAGVPGYRLDLGAPWQVDRILWSAFAESSARQLMRALRESGDTSTFGHIDPEAESIGMGVPDELIAVRVHAPEYLPMQLAALAAHVSQVDLSSGFFAAFRQVREADPDQWATEEYRYAAGTPLPRPSSPGSGAPVNDLFAGLG